MYETFAQERVAAVLDGYNSTVLAYGQTGSGKTHTMFGPDEVITHFLSCDPSLHGIVPRACEQLFQGLQKAAAGGATTTVRCSYIEVYNDRLHDLLGGAQGLALREGPEGVTVEGLHHEDVSSSAQVIATLSRGNSKRVVAAMKMNERSSRGATMHASHPSTPLHASPPRALPHPPHHVCLSTQTSLCLSTHCVPSVLLQPFCPSPHSQPLLLRACMSTLRGFVQFVDLWCGATARRLQP